MSKRKQCIESMNVLPQWINAPGWGTWADLDLVPSCYSLSGIHYRWVPSNPNRDGPNSRLIQSPVERRGGPRVVTLHQPKIIQLSGESEKNTGRGSARKCCLQKMEYIVANGSVHTAWQATSEDLGANLPANLLTRPVWTGP